MERMEEMEKVAEGESGGEDCHEECRLELGPA